MRTIWNEGRSIGLSAYELYVREALARNPRISVMSEREWLAATLDSGSSMLLKVPAGTQAGYADFILPKGCDLCAASTITGSLFEGDAVFDGPWATEVKSYGRLISNTESSHPETPGGRTCPTAANPGQMSEDYAAVCKEYLKINSGLVLQPGTWTPTGQSEPYMKLDPSYNSDITSDIWHTDQPPVQPVTTEATDEIELSWHDYVCGVVRLAISATLTKDVLILLCGFHSDTIASGSTGFYPSGTSNPENGGFLGPQEFPWATKIIMIVTTDVTSAAAESDRSYVDSQITSVNNRITSEVSTLNNTISTTASSLTTSINAVDSRLTTTATSLTNSINAVNAAKVDKTAIIDVAHGGTGANSAANARTNLGVPPIDHSASPLYSSDYPYGLAGSSTVGHVRLSDAYNSTPGTHEFAVAFGLTGARALYKELKEKITEEAVALGNRISSEINSVNSRITSLVSVKVGNNSTERTASPTTDEAFSASIVQTGYKVVGYSLRHTNATHVACVIEGVSGLGTDSCTVSGFYRSLDNHSVTFTFAVDWILVSTE